MDKKLYTGNQGIITPGGKSHTGGKATAEQMKRYEEAKKLMEEAKNPQYNVALTDPDEEALNETLHEFVFSDEYPEALDYIEIIAEHHVIVKLFRYEEETESGLVLPGNESGVVTKTLILPYAKVLVAHENSNLKRGDILAAPDDVTVINTSLEWVAWTKAQAVERPQPEDPEPTKYEGRIIDWRNSAMYVVSKEDPSEEDLWTFFLPESMFKTRISKDKFE